MNKRSNTANEETLERKYHKAMVEAVKGIVAKTAFKPLALVAGAMELNGWNLQEITEASWLGGPREKQDVAFKAKAKLKRSAESGMLVTQAISCKNSVNGGTSNQSYRGWPDKAARGAQESLNIFAKHGRSEQQWVGLLVDFLGLGTHASRIGKQSSPNEVCLDKSLTAQKKLNKDAPLGMISAEFALATLDTSFAVLAKGQEKKGRSKLPTGLLAIHIGKSEANAMRGLHAVIVVNKVRAFMRDAQEKGVSLLSAKAVATGKGRSVQIQFVDGKGKERTFMSLKRKGSKKEKYCDHLQVQLNMRGAISFMESMEAKGMRCHVQQKVA